MRFKLFVLLLVLGLLMAVVPPPLTSAQEESTNKTLDVIIVMDVSKSNLSTDPDNLRENVTKALFDLFLADADFTPTRVGVIFYSTEATLWGDRLFDSTDKTLASLSFPSPSGLTVIDKPFQLVYETFERYGTYQNENPSAVVFLTDGRPEDDEKPGSQEGERERLFAASKPWINKLAQNKTRLYVITYGDSVLEEPEWKDFADQTRGDYHPVKSLQEATNIYVQIVAQALLGYNPQKALDPVKMQPFKEEIATIEVPPVTNRLIVFALRYDPATEITLIDPNGKPINETSQNVVIRGGERDSRDKVWRVDYPEAGTWTIKFKGGTLNVEAWYFFRPYAIERVFPSENNLIKPGEPLVVKVQLEDLNQRMIVSGDLPADLRMSALVTDPQSLETSDALPMEYDSETGEFTLNYTDESVEGRYVIQYVLTVGNNSFTLEKALDNVIVGFRPLLNNIQIEPVVSNDLEGYQQDEILKAIFQVDGLGYIASPGFMNIVGSLNSESGEIKLPQEEIKDLGDGKFEVDLPYPLAPGDYKLKIVLTGQTKQGVDFGLGATDAETMDLIIEPYSDPRITSLNIDQSVNWFGSADVWLNIRRYDPSDEPSFLITMYEEGKDEPIESARLNFQDAGVTETAILYSWTSKNLTKVGNYRVVITSSEYASLSDEETLSVVYSSEQKMLFGIFVLLLVLGGATFGMSRYIEGQKVIGSLEYQKPNEVKGKVVRLSEFNSHIVSVGIGSKLIFVPGKNMKDKLFQFVGRSRSGMEIPPYLQLTTSQSNKLEVKVNYSILQGDQVRRDLRNGDIITVGDYELTYRLTQSETGKRTGQNL